MPKEEPIEIKIVKSKEENRTDADGLERVVKTKGKFLDKLARFCALAVIFLTPLFFVPYTQSVSVNKGFFVSVLILVAFICYLIQTVNKREMSYPKSLLGFSVLTLIIAFGASAIFSQAKWMSIFGGFSRPDAFFYFFIYGLAFFLTSVLFKKKDLPKIAKWFLVGLSIVSVLFLLSIVGRYFLPAFILNYVSVNTLGTMSGLSVFLGVGMITIIAMISGKQLSLSQKIWAGILGILVLSLLIVLNYWFIWVALAISTFVIALLRFVEKSDVSLPIAIIIVSLFFVFVGSKFPAFTNLPIEVRPNVSATILVDKSVFSEWKSAAIGNGPATFEYDFASSRPVEMNYTAFWATKFSQGFNFVLTLLVTTGLLGFLAFMFLLFAFIKYCARVFKNILESAPDNEAEELKEWPHIVVVSAIVFLIVALFLYPASFTQLLFIFVGLGILSLESVKTYQIRILLGGFKQVVKGLGIFLIVIVALSFALALLYLVGQKYAAAIYYEKGIETSDYNKISKAAQLDARSDVYLRTLSQAIVDQTNYAVQQSSGEDVRQFILSSISSATKFAQQAVGLNPRDSLNWSNLAFVYERIIPMTEGADSVSVEYYKRAAELEPKNPLYPVNIARVFATVAGQSNDNAKKQSSYESALNYIQNSLSLKSDYVDARFLLTQIYIKKGEIEKAVAQAENAKLSNPNDAGLAFQLGLLYYNNEQLTLAQRELERAVVLNESYSNARYFLGIIYGKNGRSGDAISQFEKIEKLNPDNAEIKTILNNLRNGKDALSGIAPPPSQERNAPPVQEKK